MAPQWSVITCPILGQVGVAPTTSGHAAGTAQHKGGHSALSPAAHSFPFLPPVLPMPYVQPGFLPLDCMRSLGSMNPWAPSHHFSLSLGVGEGSRNQKREGDFGDPDCRSSGRGVAGQEATC